MNYNNYSYDYQDAAVAAGAIGLIFVIIYLLFLLIILAVAVFEIIAMYKMFKKAGKQGWEAIIPVYNYITFYEISGYPLWYVVWEFVPVANIVFRIMAALSLAKKFKKSEGIGVVIALVPIVGYSIIGFGKNIEYDSSLGEQQNDYNYCTNPSKETKKETKKAETKTTKETKSSFCTNCGTKATKDDKFCTNCGKEL